MIGQLAQQYCKLSLPLLVLKSGAGYYLGTYSMSEGPISRESVEYWPTEAAASNALNKGTWTQRSNP